MPRLLAVVSKRPLASHLAFVALVVLAALDLLSARVNPDWLALLSRNDPVLVDYQRYATDGEGGRTLYLKTSMDASPALAAALEGLPGLAETRPAAQGKDAVWYALVLDPELDSSGREEAANQIAEQLRQRGIRFGLTGGPVLLREFRESVQRDFVRTSFLSLALVGGVLLFAFRSSPAVLLGLGHALGGLVVALAVTVRATGELNVLSAALPCVLLGLGADFVIHCLSAAGEAEAGELPSVRVYERVGLPMLGGAATTAAAFASLGLANLHGLRSLGALGAFGVAFMFGSVMLLLPPTLDRLKRRPPRCPTPFWLPQSGPWRRTLGYGLAGACLLLAALSPGVQTEERLERLYDPNLPSLLRMNELADCLGVYPSPLFLAVARERLREAGPRLAAPDLPFRLAGEPASAADGLAVVPLFVRENPFAAATLAEVRRTLQDVFGDAFVLTGEAPVSQHINALLQRGMLTAFAAVSGVLVLVLAGLFRRVRLVVVPMGMLLLVVPAVLGIMHLCDLRLSAYTLTLFPLFVGIGVDDCLYVTHLARSGGALRRSPQMVLAITLTTITTVFGYGSLLAAHNAGFRAMGGTAVVGLTLMYAGAVYLLPALLPASGRPRD